MRVMKRRKAPTSIASSTHIKEIKDVESRSKVKTRKNKYAKQIAGDVLYSEHALSKKASKIKNKKEHSAKGKDMDKSPTGISQNSKSYLREVLQSCDESDELSYHEQNSDSSDEFMMSHRSYGHRSIKSSYETLKNKI